MAVTINTNFYQEDEWKDLSKIVFTSPNMDSPANAGTRSHILPGQGALGLWYEDASHMYRIEPEQLITQSDFYNYTMDVANEVDLSILPTYIYIDNLSSDEFVRSLQTDVAVIPDGYEEINYRVIGYDLKVEYIPIQNNFTEIFSSNFKYISTVYGDTTSCDMRGVYLSYARTTLLSGWYTEVIDSEEECHITFTFDIPVNIVCMAFKAVDNKISNYARTAAQACDGDSMIINSCEHIYYFIGNYKIQGSIDNSSWVDLHTGAVTLKTFETVYISNTNYYKYYRILILNNDSISNSEVNTGYYGLSGVSFNAYTSSSLSVPEDNHISLYKFDNLQTPDVVTVKYISSVNNPTSQVTTTTGIEEARGEIIALIVAGEDGDYSNYTTNLIDTLEHFYAVDSVCSAVTVSGVGTDIIDDGYYSTIMTPMGTAQISSVVNYPTSTSINFTSSGTLTINDSNSDYVSSSTITYITTASGEVTPSEFTHDVTGYTEVFTTTTSYERNIGYNLWVSENNTCSGILGVGDTLSYWGKPAVEDLDMGIDNSILFELTFGEAYDCRLSAWDDVTHSTTINELIADDHVRVSAVAYKCATSKEAPGNGDNYVFPPSHNRIFKGDTSFGGYDYYYGDFNMVYRYEEDVFGDYLMFKPMLYGITDALSYGIHDFVITLAYSYT